MKSGDQSKAFVLVVVLSAVAVAVGIVVELMR